MSAILATKKKAKTTKKKSSFSIIVFVGCAAILVFLLASIIKVQVSINKKEADLAILQSTYESQVAENEALEDAVSKGDEAELVEEYARKKGYVMPDERVYVDITPGV
jgi:cell division protein FtsB